MSEDSELTPTNRGNMFHWGSFQRRGETIESYKELMENNETGWLNEVENEKVGQKWNKWKNK